MDAPDDKCALTGLMGIRNSPENWERAEALEEQITVAVRALAPDDSECPDSHCEGPQGGTSLCSPAFKNIHFFLKMKFWEFSISCSQRPKKEIIVIN